MNYNNSFFLFVVFVYFTLFKQQNVEKAFMIVNAFREFIYISKHYIKIFLKQLLKLVRKSLG